MRGCSIEHNTEGLGLEIALFVHHFVDLMGLKCSLEKRAQQNKAGFFKYCNG